MIRRPALRIAALTLARGVLDATSGAIATFGGACMSALRTLSEELTASMRRELHELGSDCQCPKCVARRAAEKRAEN